MIGLFGNTAAGTAQFAFLDSHMESDGEPNPLVSGDSTAFIQTGSCQGDSRASFNGGLSIVCEI